MAEFTYHYTRATVEGIRTELVQPETFACPVVSCHEEIPLTIVLSGQATRRVAADVDVIVITETDRPAPFVRGRAYLVPPSLRSVLVIGGYENVLSALIRLGKISIRVARDIQISIRVNVQTGADVKLGGPD
jgi:hypothetical protein